MKTRFLLLILLFNSAYLLAQRPDTFPVNRNDYLDVLGKYVNPNDSKEVQEVVGNFSAQLQGGSFDDKSVQSIQLLTDKMLSMRMSGNPYFIDFMHTLDAIRLNSEGEDPLQEWLLVADKMLDKSKTKRSNRLFGDFLKFSNNFYSKGTLRYSELGTNWVALADKFRWNWVDDEPVIEFQEVDLMAKLKKDSIFIKQTSGKFFALSNKWVGERGRVTWERFGDLASEIYVEFPEYSFVMNKSLYEVENARIHYPTFF
ncbi:MAG: hypothetical protein AAFO07_00655, partial [Bacteroidota bacterium]